MTETFSNQVRSQLKAIVDSDGFARSPRMQRFLTFIVEEALAGRQDELGEYAIGLAVFDRAADFEPGLDPIVRNDARRLRSKLFEYYTRRNATTSPVDQIRIEVPKGGYVPVFRATSADPVPRPRPASAKRLAVLPFELLSTDHECASYARGLCMTLTACFTGLKGVEAVAHSYVTARPLPESAMEMGLTHIVHGAILRSGRRLRAIVNLVHGENGVQLWAREYDFDANETLTSQSEIAAGVLREVMGYLGVQPQLLQRALLAAA